MDTTLNVKQGASEVCVNDKPFVCGEVYDPVFVHDSKDDCEEQNKRGFIFVTYSGDKTLVFTKDWRLVSICRFYCFSESGFLFVSENEIEQYPEYKLVKGREISVLVNRGEVLHAGLRGFAELRKRKHFIRLDDGMWRFSEADGSYRKKAVLKKVNVVGKNKAMMFDERGKLRLGSQSVHFSSVYHM